ncbi:MAG TPA: HAD-IB family phosphatase [Gemmatimonadaceae bacterium]
MSANFATVVLDVDSTLSGIEGIDWLAERRGSDVAAKIVELTNGAMQGTMPLESVYGARLDVIRPSQHEIAELAVAYRQEMAVGAKLALDRMRDAGARIVLVSGGLRQAIAPMAAWLGVADVDLHAVALRFDADGNYSGFDAASPLATSIGKRIVLEQLALPRPMLAVGDGATDVAMRDVADKFAAYVGFARREKVVAKADLAVDSFADIAHLVLE